MTARDASAFLDQAGWTEAVRAPLAGDASPRRYERITHPRYGAAVLMDADPATGEDVRPFAALTGLLRERGLSAPEIYAADLDRGFLLLEDLGDDLYARLIERRPDAETEIYAQAVDLLLDMRRSGPPPEAAGAGASMALKPYDATVLRREAALAVEWWLPGVSGEPASDDLVQSYLAEIETACAEVAEERSALVLRDYHAENLIWLPGRDGAARVGLLDYQDALIGHPAYDMASLLEDARRDVAPDLAEAMIARYLAGRAPSEAEGFRAAYAVLGAQRNLKIVGIFARLWLRDGKDRYLAHIPRVWRYLQNDLRHPALAELKAWVARWLPEPTPEALAAVRSRQGAPKPAAGAASIDTAMVMAAGLGTRMRPLTDDTPKPLLRVGGRTLLDHSLDRIREIGVSRAVVNVHYLPEQIRAHLGSRPDVEIAISDESEQLLETGGGVKRALPLIGRDAFLNVNSDNLWLGERALAPLVENWRPQSMDALLLLAPMETTRAHQAKGDFFLDQDGRLIRRGGADRAPFVYTGAQIVSAKAFEAAPDGPFSTNRIWDELIADGRCFGCVWRGGWVDVGTPDGLAVAETAYAETSVPEGAA